MQYSELAGKPVSKLVFGTATPKLFAATADGASEQEKQAAFSLLDDVYNAGVNTFDCAAHYGEEIMGEWMQTRKNREKCVILTKCAHPNQWRNRVTDYDILSDLHDSLKKLKTEYIDLYMLHRDNEEAPVSVVVDVMKRLIKEGKIKLYGASNWRHERIEAANKYAGEHGLEKMTIASPNFGLAEQVADPWVDEAHFGNGCVTISGKQNKTAREWYEKNQIPVFAYSSLARGFFSGMFRSDEPEKAKKLLDRPGILGYFCEENFEKLRRCEMLAEQKRKSVAQIALAWIYNQSFEVFAISSPVTKEQLISNIEAMEIRLTEQELRWLNLED